MTGKVVNIPRPSPELIDGIRKAFAPIAEQLDKYEIEDNKLEPVIDYALYLFAKHRKTMTNARIVRKTVEYFHLKLKAL
jgi:hypothetical protein